MQAYTRPITTLFDGQRRFEVPLFQRQYVWGAEQHWTPLWEDIERKFLQRLSSPSSAQSNPHFLGAMVLAQQRYYGNAVPAQLVIDGQQRLTTFQLFLAACRDVFNAHQHPRFAQECSRYLINEGVMAEEAVEKYKLWPTHSDRPQFIDVIDAGSREEIEKRHPLQRQRYHRKPSPRPRMIECYLYFYLQIAHLLQTKEHPHPIEERISFLRTVLQRDLQVVTVELEENDDPQVIFESLNARGEPLLPSDLLRNFIFLRVSQNRESQEALYKKYWLPFDAPFWREKETQGRLKRPRIDLFLQHYLTFQKKQEVVISHLYYEYKTWVQCTPAFLNVEEELKQLQQYGTQFKSLITPISSTPLGRFSTFLRTFEVSTVIPLVLGILGSKPDEDELNGMLEYIESYLLRRAVCNLGSKNYNRFFLTVLSKLSKTQFTRANLQAALTEQKGESVLWPDDALFKSAWLNNPIYILINPARVQYILKELEQQLYHRKSEHIEIHSSLSVEHIIPDRWLDNWPLPNGTRGVTRAEQSARTRSAEDEALTEKRDRLKHTIGNLTLLTQSLNSAISNASFEVKKPEILNSSALALNRCIRGCNTWDESNIITRAEDLFALAQRKWSYPQN